MQKYFVCLKHGNKYDSEYVNTLYNMFKRNCTLDVQFVCFTENSAGIDKHIEVRPLPKTTITGWWYKPMFFNQHLGLQGTLLFCDLDVIIFQNIDKLYDYKPGKFCIIRDFNRMRQKNWQRMNSSVFRLDTGTHSHVYDEFIQDPVKISRRFHGDQDWIFNRTHDREYEFWPDEWIQSYKWEMRGDAPMKRDSKGVRNFTQSAEPQILQDTSIAVFHGQPNPKECIDDWCRKNWR